MNFHLTLSLNVTVVGFSPAQWSLQNFKGHEPGRPKWQSCLDIGFDKFICFLNDTCEHGVTLCTGNQSRKLGIVVPFSIITTKYNKIVAVVCCCGLLSFSFGTQREKVWSRGHKQS